MLGKIRGIDKQVNSLNDILTAIDSMQKLMLKFLYNKNYIFELEINPCVVEKQTGKMLALDGVVKIEQNTMNKDVISKYYQ